MTRSWAGAFLAVTSAVRIGARLLSNAFCIADKVFKNLAKGPSGRGFVAFLISLA
jgi:hypothetical protein